MRFDGKLELNEVATKPEGLRPCRYQFNPAASAQAVRFSAAASAQAVRFSAAASAQAVRFSPSIEHSSHPNPRPQPEPG